MLVEQEYEVKQQRVELQLQNADFLEGQLWLIRGSQPVQAHEASLQGKHQPE